EPILFVIRKQRRLSSTEVTPLAYYYIINGTVLQAPDLSTLLNSRLLTTVNNLTKTLQALAPCARYHPSDGSYSWDDAETLMGITVDATEPEASSRVGVPQLPARPSQTDQFSTASVFQVQRTSVLLNEWASRFPLPTQVFTPVPGTTPIQTPSGTTPFNSNPSMGSSTTPSVPAASATVGSISGSAADDRSNNNNGNESTTNMSRPVKDEPTVASAQPRPVGAKFPVIPGVGPNAMSSLFSNLFPQSPTGEKKPKLP
ncbi:Mediator of RNA polymerase II transcription subunit 6, partial [Fasciolopsis buskii]